MNFSCDRSLVVTESLRIVGLKNTIRFLFCTDFAEDLNSPPTIGISPSKGTLLTDSWTSSLIRPPKTIISLSSARIVLSISLLLVIKSVELGSCDPAILETSCLINNATESDSFIWGFISSLTPISSLDVVLNGVRLFEPNDSPVVIGISCPTNSDASSLSRATTEGVERIFESWSSLNSESKTAKLSSPLSAVSYTHLTLPTIYSV